MFCWHLIAMTVMHLSHYGFLSVYDVDAGDCGVLKAYALEIVYYVRSVVCFVCLNIEDSGLVIFLFRLVGVVGVGYGGVHG